ncbi:PfaD family polyunsaturated fatty acid/polyketide biosynthesis protein [Sorangium sp. So ce315]|uniref:PfaD family polyunsaturated fatty acid/polyketide biosynthesis protein n=1 Tax=Sorangium sp. So ce315 TaxID=3133299 RepID=UPI003F5FE520
MINATSLGDPEFRADYGLKYAYVAGAMYKGIASKELVVAMGKAGHIAFLGTGGLDLDEVESSIRYIQSELSNAPGGSYGMNLLSNLEAPDQEERAVDLYLRYGIRCVEAAAFVRITSALVRYRVKGIRADPEMGAVPAQRVLAKVSRPEVASAFMQPPPDRVLRDLVASGGITAREAELAGFIPMADDVCVEADSGGHTDRGVAYALMPAMFALRDEMMARYRYGRRIRVGAAGGIGAPAAAAAAFVMGADFILTGSINQCTREARTSDSVKALLQQIDVQDTAYAPAGDMFELGAKVQVVRRGLFFPARANRLHELYMRHNSLDEVDPTTRRQIEHKYFKRSFEQVWEETRAYYAETNPRKLGEIERSPKQKMAAVFRWYFAHTTRLALDGIEDERFDYQIHCGPALGAFNRWVKGTDIEPWQNRRVAELAERLMRGTAELLTARFSAMNGGDAAIGRGIASAPLSRR